jgi:hypothetical protein
LDRANACSTTPPLYHISFLPNKISRLLLPLLQLPTKAPTKRKGGSFRGLIEWMLCVCGWVLCERDLNVDPQRAPELFWLPRRPSNLVTEPFYCKKGALGVLLSPGVRGGLPRRPALHLQLQKGCCERWQKLPRQADKGGGKGESSSRWETTLQDRQVSSTHVFSPTRPLLLSVSSFTFTPRVCPSTTIF